MSFKTRRLDKETRMFTHDLDPTASYRTLARGIGSGFTRAYQASQQARAESLRPHPAECRAGIQRRRSASMTRSGLAG